MAKKNKNLSVAKQQEDNKKVGGATGKGFMPGQSGNPYGRAKTGWSWADLIREYGDMNCPPEYARKVGFSSKQKWKKVVIAAAFRHAASGNAAILKTLIEYIDGHAPLVAINNNTTQQTVIVLPAVDDDEYDPIAALRETPLLLAPIIESGNGKDENVNGNGFHS